MKNIEKALMNYLEGKGPKVGAAVLCECAVEDANKVIDILFKSINSVLDSTLDIKSLENVRELLKYVSIILINSTEINRKIVNRKLKKLDEKIDRLECENRKKYRDINRAFRELELTRKELLEVQDQTSEKETKQYDFISYLINKIRNITYLEYAFNKMPNLANAKDKEESSLLRNIVMQYIESMKDDDGEDILYYNNIMSLLFSLKSLNISELEKRKILESINCAIDQLSVNKKSQKKNKSKIELLTTLAENVKGHNERQVEVAPIAKKYNISINFDEEILEKAELVEIEKEGEISNREVIDDYIITIDKETAIEIDDALSCRKLPNGNYLLGVHIASILGYFPYESDIVQEAISRDKSIYLFNCIQDKENDFKSIIPIFPYEFSANKASLIPGEKRLARSYYFEIDLSGNVVNERFIKSIITSSKKASYREIDEVLEKGTENEQLQELVNNLQAITNILDMKYKGTNIYEQVKESREDYSELAVKKIGSEKIVYQTMILTGNRVAEFFAKKFYPCLYRVHEVNETDTVKLEAMINTLTDTYGGDQYKKLYQLIQGIYPRGWYASSGGHSGLNLEHYCHCTSGLRRGADIVVEHALEVCYDKEPSKEELEKLRLEIEEKVKVINAKEDPIDWFVRDFQRVYRRR